MRIILPSILAVALAGSVAKATPYASALTNNAGTVSFILNEAADDVKIIYGTTTNLLGSKPAGLVTANVGASSPFSVQVTKNSGIGYKTAASNWSGTISWAGKLQISTDPVLARFPNPRGVAVDRNPGSPYFGRIYVANSTAGTTTTGARAVGRGLYCLNADFSDSPNAYGNTAKTAGLTFATSANSPFRLSVGQDNLVYISDYSDANGSVYRCNGDLLGGEMVLATVGGNSPLPGTQNHGSTLKAIAEGSLAAGNLKIYTIDEDYGQTTTTAQNDVLRYDINSGPLPFSGTPTKVSGVLIKAALVDDFCKGGVSNYLYLVQNRSVAATPATATPSLYVVDESGNTVTNALALWREFTGNATADNVLTNVHSVAISPDGKYLAAILQTTAAGAGTSKSFIMPLVNGIPDLANLKLLDSGSANQGRSIDFDAAGNLYTLSSGDQILRAFSPGGFSVTTTTSDGTFNVVAPTTSVSVSAVATNVAEGSSVDLVFTRTGDTSGPLTVSYNLTGTAANGSDFSIPADVTFAAGEATANATVSAIDDSAVESIETVTVTLVASPAYEVTTPFAATVSILDNETPELSITAVSTNMYERLANDYLKFRITRLGSLASGITANISYGGTADPSRYNASTGISMDAGLATVDFTVQPVNDALLNSNATITATIVGGSYTVGANATATGTIIDDEYPTETVLFSDGLNTDTSGQWTVRFGANNLIDDFRLNFGYLLSDDNIPNAPNGADSALRVAVNKVDATTNGAAGINLYPVGQTFSGDFALRFDLYVQQNTGGGITEFSLFGINHSGNKTNWVRLSGTAPYNNPPRDCDGLWFSMSSDGGGSAPGDYALLTGTNAANTATTLTNAAATAFTSYFKKPPYSSALAGVPGNVPGSSTKSWADVEVKKIGSIVTLSINKTQVLRYTNTTAYTSGNIMIGYMDPYESIDNTGATAYFSNLRVVDLTSAVPQTPNITAVAVISGGTQVQIDFTGSGDTSAFTLQSSSTVDGTYADTAASIVSTGTGTYRATTSVSGATKFYRLKR